MIIDCLEDRSIDELFLTDYLQYCTEGLAIFQNIFYKKKLTIWNRVGGRGSFPTPKGPISPFFGKITIVYELEKVQSHEINGLWSLECVGTAWSGEDLVQAPGDPDTADTLYTAHTTSTPFVTVLYPGHQS